MFVVRYSYMRRGLIIAMINLLGREFGTNYVNIMAGAVLVMQAVSSMWYK